jgi:hypothetical protein
MHSKLIHQRYQQNFSQWQLFYRRLTVFVAVLLLCTVSSATDQVGTNGNDLLICGGVVQELSVTLTNPYSGEVISDDDVYNVNADTYNGLEGTDTLLLSNVADALFLVNDANQQTLVSVERVVAGDGGDIINLASKTILLGDTFIDGGLGNDLIWANAGNDTINASGGNDRVDGGPGNDTISGGDGNDVLDGGSGDDIVRGDAGDDTLVYTVSQNVGNTDVYDGGSGIDTLVLKLTNAQASAYAADIASAQAFVAANSNSSSSAGPSYQFSSFGLSFSNIESIQVVITDPVLYQSGGICHGEPGHQILQPINPDGSSVWKKGSTVPAKFRVCDVGGNSVGLAGVVTAFKLIKIIAGTTTAVDEAVVSTTPDTAFRWDATAEQWIFNVNTKGLSGGQTYVYQIQLNDGSSIFFQFGLK